MNKQELSALVAENSFIGAEPNLQPLPVFEAIRQQEIQNDYRRQEIE